MQVRRRRSVAFVAAAMATVLVAAACGGADSPSGQGGQGGTPGEHDPDATFTWVHSVPIVSMDPHLSTNSYDYPYLFFVYDRLTHLDPKGEPQPMLAESWEVLEEGRKLRLTLRDGVTFHDGTPFDAEAVKANFERMRDNPRSAVKAQIASIESETVDAADTVTLNLTDASAGALPAILGGFAGTMVSPAAFDDPELPLIGVGAGPYKAVENRGQDGVTLERFDGYWEPEAQKVAKIVARAITDDETRLNAVLTSAVDGAIIRAHQVDRARGGGLGLVQAITASPTALEINMSRSEFEDRRVRQAMAYALNRQEIADAAFGGACETGQQVFNKNYWAYAADVGEPYSHDVEKARSLLAEAGLAGGFSFDLLVNPSPAYQTTAEVIQAQLAQAGITVNIKVLPGPETTAEFWSKRAADSSVQVDAFALDPSVVIATFTGPTGFRNVGQYVNAQLNDLATQATATADRDERKDLYGQILKIMVDEAVQPLVICFQQQTWAFANDTTGFVIGDSGLWDFRYIQKGR